MRTACNQRAQFGPAKLDRSRRFKPSQNPAHAFSSTLHTALIMSKALPSLIALVVLGVAAAALNPSADKHRTRIKEAVAERSQIAKVLGVGHLAAFVSQYHSVGVASYTTVNDKLTSVGAFGIVVTTE